LRLLRPAFRPDRRGCRQRISVGEKMLLPSPLMGEGYEALRLWR
jgi:hypothetical protein